MVRVQLQNKRDPEMVLVTYERLVSHCFRCGLIGHLVKDCLEEAHIYEKRKEIFKYCEILEIQEL